MIITFIAPPAAGKGTLSIKVSQKWNIPHISTGDLLRNVEDENVKQKLSEGKFISDNIVISLLEKRIKESDAKNGYILDGFPRNLNQAKMYETLLQKLNLNQGIVIILDLDKEMAAKRITHRKVCPNCGAIYNDMFESTKPKVKNICDNCQNNLIKRSDDNMKTFEDRYQTLEVPCPCLLTVLSTLTTPRYMNVWDIVAQEEKQIGKITFADIEVKQEDIGLNGSPTKVKSTATKQFDKTIETKELDPESAAKAIVDALKQKYLI